MRRLIAFVIIAASALHAQQKMYSTWDFPGITAPGTSGLAASWYRLYFKAGVGFCFKDSSGTETCPSASGGAGIVTMTTGSADPTSNCTAPSSSNLATYYQTTSKTLWFCTDTNTWRKNIDVNPASAWLILGNTGTAPSTPSAGTVAIYSVDGKLYAKDSSGVVTTTVTANQNYRDIPIVFDGAGVALTGPATRCRVISEGGTINSYTALADTTGNATIVLKAGSYGSYTGPASITTDISNGGETLSSAVKMQDTTLTGWTTALSPGTVVCATLSSPSSITWLEVTLRISAN